MPKICYKTKNFANSSLLVIQQSIEIIEEYAQQGFDLTLRQLFYQHVSRGLLPNTQKSYKRLGSIVNDARMAGLIDWNTIVDRTRQLRSLANWSSPADIVESCASQYHVDMWKGQPYRPECFSPETPVLTRAGFVDIGSIEIGDEVLTHEGRWRPVTKVIRTAYEGVMLNVRAAGVLPFLVTPNHPLYIRPYDDNFPKRKGATRRFRSIAWADSHQLKQHDRLLLPRLGRRYSKRVVKPLFLVGGSKSKQIALTIDQTALQVIGLYVAEGNIRSDRRTVQFTFGEHEVAHADLVKSWAASIDVNSHTVFGPGTCVVYLFSKALSDWFSENFGNGAFHKCFPTWLVEAPVEMQMPALEFYFRGDGCFWDESRASIDATTRSRNLALQVQLLLTWAGYATSVDDLMDAGALRYRVSVGGADVVRLADLWKVETPEKGLGRSRRYNHVKADAEANFAEFPVRRIEDVPYKGDVINLEVEGDHSYCVPVIAHNCWVEKDALLGVVERICNELDVPFFSCRGYTSQSEMWSASQRLVRYSEAGQTPYIIHLGDHDPSGIDMSRDIYDRLHTFMEYDTDPAEVNRIALNMDQIKQYDPPPNPAKLTDSRARSYIVQYGASSWELDALEPQVLSALIRATVENLRDDDLWEEKQEEQQAGRDQLQQIADEM